MPQLLQKIHTPFRFVHHVFGETMFEDLEVCRVRRQDGVLIEKILNSGHTVRDISKIQQAVQDGADGKGVWFQALCQQFGVLVLGGGDIADTGQAL
jgi:hypothetical protein